MSQDPGVKFLASVSNLMVGVNSCLNFIVYIKKDFRSPLDLIYNVFIKFYSGRFQCELKVIISVILEKIKFKSGNVLNTGASLETTTV